MKNHVFTLLAILWAFGLNAQEKSFSGKFEGLNSATIDVTVLPLKHGATPIFGKIKCSDGNFSYRIDYKLNMWHLVQLGSEGFNMIFGKEKTANRELRNREIQFFIQPGDSLSISTQTGEYGIFYQVSGNQIGVQQGVFKKELFPLEEEFNRLVLLKEKAEAGNQSGEANEVEEKKQAILTKMEKADLSLIIRHPDWIYSAERFAAYQVDTIAKYFGIFSPEVKESFFGKHLEKIIFSAETGSSAPGFTLPDEKGENVSLSSFKGKYVVLDFWGTWCGVCIKGIPKMKEYNLKCRGKVEFISICCRDDKNSWLAALKKYRMSWTSLFAEDLQIPERYGVEGYPTKIIIDKEGKIVFKSIGEEDDFYNKMDELFCK